MSKSRLVISFSGGRSSAVMTRKVIAKYGDTHDVAVIFANTGLEHPNTLNFINDCDKHWGFNTVWLEAVVSSKHGVGIRHKVVNFATAARNGEPFEAAVAKYGVFSVALPQCTSRLKIEVMASYLKREKKWEKGTYRTAVGIRADEIDRISDRAEDQGIFYPLFELGIDKKYVDAYMRRFDWDLNLPGDHYGNCVPCWKKSQRKLLTIAKDDPSWFAPMDRMEQLYGRNKVKPAPAKADLGNGQMTIPATLDQIPDAQPTTVKRRVFYRGGLSAQDIVTMAQNTVFVPY